MVGVAQLVEPRLVMPVVVGSSPIVHPISLIQQRLNFIGWRSSSRAARIEYDFPGAVFLQAPACRLQGPRQSAVAT